MNSRKQAEFLLELTSLYDRHIGHPNYMIDHKGEISFYENILIHFKEEKRITDKIHQLCERRRAKDWKGLNPTAFIHKKQWIFDMLYGLAHQPDSVVSKMETTQQREKIS